MILLIRITKRITIMKDESLTKYILHKRWHTVYLIVGVGDEIKVNELLLLAYFVVSLFLLPLHGKDGITLHTPVHSPLYVAFLLFLSILLLIGIEVANHSERNEIDEEMKHYPCEWLPTPLSKEV